MTKEEIIALLKRKKEDSLALAEWSMTKHNNNSETWNDYYEGQANGIDIALSIIGMLDKKNNNLNPANYINIYYPKDRFSSYEEYVKYLKEKGLALEAKEGTYKN